MNYPPYDPNNPQQSTTGPYPSSPYPQFNQQPSPSPYPTGTGQYPPQYPQSGQYPQYSQPMQPPQYPPYPPQPGPPPQYPPQVQKDPWYKTNGGIITLLFLFFPAGLFLMWQYAKWSPKTKWIVTGILAFFVAVSGISNAAATNMRVSTTTAKVSDDSSSSSDTSSNTNAASEPTDTPTPTPVPTWQTTHTYSGNGNKKTETFTVGDDWKLQWSCTPSSSYFGEYNLIVDVRNSDGSSADLAAVNTICKSGNVSGETEERVSGNIYLDVQSEGAWTMTIQELK